MAQVGEGWVIPPPALFGHMCEEILTWQIENRFASFF